MARFRGDARRVRRVLGASRAALGRPQLGTLRYHRDLDDSDYRLPPEARLWHYSYPDVCRERRHHRGYDWLIGILDRRHPQASRATADFAAIRSCSLDCERPGLCALVLEVGRWRS